MWFDQILFVQEDRPNLFGACQKTDQTDLCLLAAAFES
jgi:hypothetical protein